MKKFCGLVLLLALCIASPASAQVVSGPIAITAQDAGNCVTANACATFNVTRVPAMTLEVTGTWTGTLTFQCRSYGTYINVTASNVTSSTLSATTTANGTFSLGNFGYDSCRVVGTTLGSGAVSVALRTGYFVARNSPSSVVLGTLAGTNTPALSTSATWNDGAVQFTHWQAVITDTASAPGSLPISVKGGAAGTTNLFSVDKTGVVTSGAAMNSGAAVTATSGMQAGASNIIGWSGLTRMVSSVDGKLTLYNNALTSFTILQFGCTTSSCPALKANGTSMEARLSDDSAYANFRGLNLFTGVGGAFYLNNTMMTSATAPTVSSGFGTSPTIASNNGTASFTINVGTGGVATSGVVGLPTSATGWNCFVSDQTTNVATRQTASTTTTATLTAASAWTASDILIASCFAR
jgi:hypothetical protein